MYQKNQYMKKYITDNFNKICIISSVWPEKPHSAAGLQIQGLISCFTEKEIFYASTSNENKFTSILNEKKLKQKK